MTVKENINFRVKINPYLESIMGEADCPIRIQFEPSPLEHKIKPGEEEDIVDEEHTHCGGVIVHKYPQRCLLMACNTCAALCRFCTRKSKVYSENQEFPESAYEEAFRYIKDNCIEDVLLSGGDPLMLPDARLRYLLERLKEIDTVRIVRIGSRIPCTLPSRVTDSLVKMFEEVDLKYMNIHFECFEELTPQSIEALTKLRKAGVSLGSQTVLLKGVNDSTQKLAKLFMGLLQHGVTPYYLYYTDVTYGCSHFRVPLKQAIQIYLGLRGNISGMAIPYFVFDVPHGVGKTPINPYYMEEVEEGKWLFKGYNGKTYLYDEGQML